MSDIRTSFNYSPIRQGYDTNSWRTVSGSPAIGAGGRLIVDTTAEEGAAVHYADFLKGDISFNVNVPAAPGAGAARLFGVSSLNTVAYIRFSIDDALTCQTSDGTTTTESSTIEWNSNWTGANIVFRIRWEPGTAKFFINGSQVYAVTDDSVPHGPLSLYLSDNSDAAMTVGDMAVRGTQSYVMHLKTSDTASYGGLLSSFQNVTVSENLSMLLVNLSLPYVSGALSESVTVSEAVQISISIPSPVFESVTVSENLTIFVANHVPNVNDSVTVTENLSMYQGGESMISVSDTVTVTENSVVSV